MWAWAIAGALVLWVALLAIRKGLHKGNEVARTEFARMQVMYPDAYAEFRQSIAPEQYSAGGTVNYAKAAREFYAYLVRKGIHVPR